MDTLKLYWLGPPRIEFGGQIIKLETRKATALLAYLSLTTAPCQREALAALFWPESSKVKAHASLRRGLSSLSSCLPGWIQADRETVTLKRNDRLWVDVGAFHRARMAPKVHHHAGNVFCDACMSALTEAVGYYRGEFLEGLGLDDCANFAEWESQQRRDIQWELRQALESDIQQSALACRWERAILAAERLLNLDRLDEASHRKLMWVLAKQGRKSAALEQYEACARILRGEGGRDPELKTTQLYKAIRDGDPIQLKGLEETLEVVPEVSPTIPASGLDQRQNRFLDTIVRTKLFVPPVRAGAVSRARLIAQISRGVQGALTVVSAPAGFGKTTLLASWAAAYPSRVGWVSLDAEDNDALRVTTYLILALKSVRADIGEVCLEMLSYPQRPPARTILAALLNEISALDTEFVVVLDDYHVITGEPVRDAVAFLIDHLCPNLHLVIVTRSDPLLPLARLRAKNQLAELRAEDLRFQAEEAAEFLSRSMGLDLPPQDVAVIGERTEGWITGLQMAALSMTGKQDKAAFIQTFDGRHHYVLDYLTDEVLSRQPESVQAFLMQTSILERFNASLCDAVTGGENGQEMLELLERLNLFLVPLDDQRCWYRYHQLFADLLRVRLRQSRADTLQALHLKAARWFEENGFEAEAVDHTLAAGDFERASRLVEKIAVTMWIRGEITNLLKWIDSLPKALSCSRPRLCIYYAFALEITGQLAGVETLLQTAERGLPLEEHRSDSRRMRGFIAAIRAYAATTNGKLDEAIDLSKKALADMQADDPLELSYINEILGIAYYLNNNLQDAASALLCGASLGLAAGTINVTSACYAKLAEIYKLRGQLQDALGLYQKMIKMGQESGPQFRVLGPIQGGLGDLLREMNDLDGAQEKLTEAVRHLRSWGNPNDWAFVTLNLATVQIARGAVDEALINLRKAEQIIELCSTTALTRSLFEACQVRLWLSQGRLKEAAEWAERKQAAGLPSNGIHRELELIAVSRVLIALGKSAQAIKLLEQLAVSAQAGGHAGRMIEMHVLRAMALQAAGKQTAAFRDLEKGLILAEPGPYVRVFIDEAKPMRSLLREYCLDIEAGKRQIQDREAILKYVNKLLDAFVPSSGSESKIAGEPHSSVTEPLTDRELEILRLLCSGYTNRQIADKVFISDNTVKSHVHHIFGKIGVQSRTQLILRARELNLI